MAYQAYLYLKLLLRDKLSLALHEYEWNETRRGLVCQFFGLELTSVFQAISRADGKIVGRKTLLRVSHKKNESLKPFEDFEHSVNANKLVQFDRLVRTAHLLSHARSFTEHELMFLNVPPRLLASVSNHGRTFEQILHYYSVPTSQVVFEIKESAVKDDVRLKAAVPKMIGGINPPSECLAA